MRTLNKCKACGKGKYKNHVCKKTFILPEFTVEDWEKWYKRQVVEDVTPPVTRRTCACNKKSKCLYHELDMDKKQGWEELERTKKRNYVTKIHLEWQELWFWRISVPLLWVILLALWVL